MKSNKYIARFLETLDQLDREGHQVPGLILSIPGTGKTSTIRKWCEYKDYNLVTLIPSQQAADDILGLQSMVDGKLVRLTPSWYDKMMEIYNKNKKRVCLFIDEISTCDSYLQGPLLDLIFSHNLGEKHLPENCFIVAAGNYSSDLNNAFKMSAPLINRFVLLNLDVSDFNIMEYMEDDFSKVRTKKEIEEYFDLTEDEKKPYSFEKFKNWITASGEISFTKSNYTEIPNIGLCGFTSVRSLGYAMHFMQAYTAKYSDRFWMRVVGDTLGTSEKREKKPIRLVLEAKENEFFAAEPEDKVSFGAYCKKITTSGCLTEKELKTLEAKMNKLSPADLTNDDLKQWTELTKTFSQLPEIKTLNSKLIEKISRF